MRRYRTGTRWGVWLWTERNYIRRLHLIKAPNWSIYVHWILGPDPQPDLHDHPVSFLSVVLRGGYIERLGYDPAIHRRITWLNWIPFRKRHRITWVMPGTVTVCFA